MPTEHFNQLTEAEAERLTLLIEECGEVIQAACKIQRYGYASTFNGASYDNRSVLTKELGRLKYAMELVMCKGDVSAGRVQDAMLEKRATIKPFLHHQA